MRSISVRGGSAVDGRRSGGAVLFELRPAIGDRDTDVLNGRRNSHHKTAEGVGRDFQQLRIDQGPDGRVARRAGQQRHFAEEAPGTDARDLLTVRLERHHGLTSHHHEHRCPGVALTDHDLAGPVQARRCGLRELLVFLVAERRKNRHGPQGSPSGVIDRGRGRLFRD